MKFRYLVAAVSLVAMTASLPSYAAPARGTAAENQATADLNRRSLDAAHGGKDFGAAVPLQGQVAQEKGAKGKVVRRAKARARVKKKES